MRLDRKNFRNHALWAVTATLLTVVLICWYAWESYGVGYPLRGGSQPGLVCGIVAGSIIAFEMLLWPRKFLRAWRLIATRHWLAAHLWFGLASLPLAYAHCGLHTGGMLPTLLLVLFTLTIISGLIGWCLQHILPKLILKNVQAETVCSQIPQVSQQNLENAYALLTSLVGPPAYSLQSPGSTDAAQSKASPGVESSSLSYRSSKPATVVLGAVRATGRIRGRTLRTAQVSIDPKHAERLWEVYRYIEPYLKVGRRSRSEIADPLRASDFFAAERTRCGSSCHEVIDTLEQYCDERRQFDLQLKLNAALHGWLPFHIGLSVAVTVLLIGHIITALRY